MMPRFEHRANLAALAAAGLLACAGCGSATGGASQNPPLIQPGAPGQASKVVGAAQAADQSKVQATAADVKFMQGMIHHHAQAIDMVALLKTRTSSDDMRKLGERIEISQRDEIKMMRNWLIARGQDAPDPHAMSMSGMDMAGMEHDPVMMPGMLTPAEMEHLATLKGVEFDKAFLEGMIKHHGGAISMVQDLFAAPGAAQESVVFAFASDVDADQRMEIDRMAAMLARLKEHQQ